MIQRGHDPERGRWSIPGGRVEPGESDAAAVVREVAEETALTVTVGDLCGRVVRGPFEIYDYACRVAAGRLTAGDDAAAVRWVDGAEFAALEAGGELVSKLADTLREWGVAPTR